jgi:hypothetical protein
MEKISAHCTPLRLLIAFISCRILFSKKMELPSKYGGFILIGDFAKPIRQTIPGPRLNTSCGLTNAKGNMFFLSQFVRRILQSLIINCFEQHYKFS